MMGISYLTAYCLTGSLDTTIRCNNSNHDVVDIRARREVCGHGCGNGCVVSGTLEGKSYPGHRREICGSDRIGSFGDFVLGGA